MNNTRTNLLNGGRICLLLVIPGARSSGAMVGCDDTQLLLSHCQALSISINSMLMASDTQELQLLSQRRFYHTHLSGYSICGSHLILSPLMCIMEYITEETNLK